ncbi:double zinc ribbon domain-containing protein [Halorussus halobius]|uniref:double zinc ribbon domain-containing protein n=1 Tax=Halorussus halobius TaxID=1710537 RepID=UPI0010921B10|nr:zinc ribbon domain-containing protein [Halorussus halobius]
MSKITFRADEDLVERIEARDASKSEIMREALRAYLDRETPGPNREPEPDRRARGPTGSLDALLAERVDELVAERLGARESHGREDGGPQDVNVDVTLESAAPARADVGSGRAERSSDDRSAVETSDAVAAGETACGQCGESLAEDHVYCPNCGEKATRRLFCECGDEVRSDWGFCPGCGRRTPAADVLDRS